MYGQPGKKLLFMGGEFGQWSEWYHEASLDWHLLDSPAHRGVQRWVEDLNRFYRQEPALFEPGFQPRRLRVDRLQRRGAERHHLSAERAGPEELILVAWQLYPGAPAQLPGGGARRAGSGRKS